jgi:hypothetical protein
LKSKPIGKEVITVRIYIENGNIKSIFSNPGTRVKVERGSVLIKDL